MSRKMLQTNLDGHLIDVGIVEMLDGAPMNIRITRLPVSGEMPLIVKRNDNEYIQIGRFIRD